MGDIAEIGEECPADAAESGAIPTESEGERTFAALARALGHPARVRILKSLIVRDGCVVGELAGEIPLAASTVSQHLKILKAAGLIKGEVDGPRRCYCVDRSVVHRFKRLVEAL